MNSNALVASKPSYAHKHFRFFSDLRLGNSEGIIQPYDSIAVSLGFFTGFEQLSSLKKGLLEKLKCDMDMWVEVVIGVELSGVSFGISCPVMYLLVVHEHFLSIPWKITGYLHFVSLSSNHLLHRLLLFWNDGVA